MMTTDDEWRGQDVAVHLMTSLQFTAACSQCDIGCIGMLPMPKNPVRLCNTQPLKRRRCKTQTVRSCIIQGWR